MVKKARCGEVLLDVRFLGLPTPPANEVDPDKFNIFYRTRTDVDVLNLQIQTYSYDDIEHTQLMYRMDFKKQLLEKCQSTDDLKVLYVKEL